MTPEEIVALGQAMREAIEGAQPMPPKLLFNTREASEITGIPESYFEREAPAGRIPSHWLPASPGSDRGYRRYSLADLEVIAAAAQVKPTSGPLARTARSVRRAA